MAAVAKALLLLGCVGCVGSIGLVDADDTAPEVVGNPHPEAGTPAPAVPAVPATPRPGQQSGVTAPGSARDPGRVILHRLAASQYNSTVRDLLGTALRPGDRFPSDLGGALEFENNAQHLATSPLHVSLHEVAATELVDEAFRTPASRMRVVSCDPAAGTPCIRELATAFGARAWRRPLATSEVDRLVQLAGVARNAGASADEAARTVAKALLLSPHFLYRIELDSDPTSTTPRLLGDHELASRLSYFLWNTMPDETLFEAARTGKLRDSVGARAQVERMLGSPRSEALAQTFGAQWLGTIVMEGHQVDAGRFSAFDVAMARSMKREAELFVGALIEENRPGADLLLGRFGHLDARLARHYGVAAPGREWQRADFATPQRGGLLGLGGVLTATSSPNRTSLVKRGHWVLTNVLCSEPPPAPPDVPALEDSPSVTGTQREILEAHRTRPACRACHQAIDGIGFALERYDAIGRWRDTEGNRPIDDQGIMPDGTSFKGPRELAAVLARDTRASACVTRQLLTYALGRNLSASDEVYLTDIDADSVQAGHRFKDVIVSVAMSEPFRMRRGTPNAPGGAR